MEHRELAAPLHRAQRLEIGDELHQLGLLERRGREGGEMAPLVLEVALHAHGAEKEPAERELPTRRGEPVGERPHVRGIGDGRAVRAPRDRCRRAGGVARREAEALVEALVFGA